jgi:hypothetical protein
LHHCNGLIKMIETDMLIVYFGAQMKKICTRQDIRWARWEPHQARCDALPHRIPGVCDTSSIQENTPSLNQEPVRGSKGPPPHENELETSHTYPYTPWGSPCSHPDERRCRWNRLGFKRTKCGPAHLQLTRVPCSRLCCAFPRCAQTLTTYK